MKKQISVLGTSLLGLAMFTGVAAAAGPGEPGDEAVIEAPPASTTPAVTETTTVEEEEERVSPRGFYVGGSIGGSFWDGADNGSRIYNADPTDSDFDGFPENAFTTDRLDDQENLMWSAFIGYRLADWLGAEVGWTDIGGFTAIDVNDPSNPADPPHDNRTFVNVDGVEARLRGWYPFPFWDERLSGIGGLGIFIFSSHPPKACYGPDTGACQKPPGALTRVPPALDPRHDSGQAFTLSAGLQVRITDNVLLRTEYQHFFEVLDQGVDMVTASIVIGFYDFFGQAKGGDSIGGVVIE